MDPVPAVVWHRLEGRRQMLGLGRQRIRHLDGVLLVVAALDVGQPRAPGVRRRDEALRVEHPTEGVNGAGLDGRLVAAGRLMDKKVPDELLLEVSGFVGRSDPRLNALSDADLVPGNAALAALNASLR